MKLRHSSSSSSSSSLSSSLISSECLWIISLLWPGAVCLNARKSDVEANHDGDGEDGDDPLFGHIYIYICLLLLLWSGG